MGRNKQVLFLLLILLVTLTVYAPSIKMYFLSEDYAWRATVINRPVMELVKLFIPENWGGEAHGGFYHPLVGVVYWANWNLTTNPAWFHVTNVLFHLLTCVAVFLLAKTISKNAGVSLVSTLLFAVFPFSTEAVSWIDGRHDLLMTVTYLYAVVIYINAKNQKEKIPAYLFFILSLTAKEAAVTLPLVTAAFDIMNKKKNVVINHIPFLLIGVAYFLVHTASVGSGNPWQSAAHVELTVSRAFLITVVTLAFMGIMTVVLIKKQSIKPEKTTIKNLMIAGSATVFSWLPTATLYTQERYLYLPAAFAVIVVTVFGCMVLQKSKKTKLIIGLTGAIMVAAISGTYVIKRNGDWLRASKIARDTLVSSTETLEKIPQNETVYIVNLPDNINGSYIFRTHMKEAIEHKTGKKFKQMVTTPTVMDDFNSKAEKKGESLLLQTRGRFLIFKPTVKNTSASAGMAIETNDYTATVSADLKTIILTPRTINPVILYWKDNSLQRMTD